MMRTATADSPTRDRLLDAAERLMLAKGYAATTVEAICEAARLTKGSFFHYFESKDHLGRELLKRFCAQGEALHRGFYGQERDPLKRVYAYVDSAARMVEDPSTKGCLLGSFAQELCDVNPSIREACAEGFEGWASQFAEELARAKAQHPPKTAFEPRELANHLLAILEGSLILGKATRDMKAAAANLKHFKAYLKMLFGQ